MRWRNHLAQVSSWGELKTHAGCELETEVWNVERERRNEMWHTLLHWVLTGNTVCIVLIPVSISTTHCVSRQYPVQKKKACDFPKTLINTKIKVLKNQRRAMQFYFPIEVHIIFSHHYIMSGFISYLFVIFNIRKHNKKKRSNSTTQIFLSAPTFLFVYPATPTWLGIATSHLSATACGWP